MTSDFTAVGGTAKIIAKIIATTAAPPMAPTITPDLSMQNRYPIFYLKALLYTD